MATLDFYAIGDDVHDIVRFIFAETDARIFESYSEPEAELREFRSYEELTSGCDLGAGRHPNGSVPHLQLWSPSVMPDVVVRRISLRPPGPEYRYCISGAGLMQLYFGREENGIISGSHFGHWNEAGARARYVGDADAVDWRALARLGGRIGRRIRERMAVASVHGRPILPAAFEALVLGAVLRYGSYLIPANSPEILRARGIGT